MEYLLDREYNIIVKVEDGGAEFIPYSGVFSKDIDAHNPHEYVRMSPISSEKAENFIKASGIAKKAHVGQKDKAGKDYFYHPCTVVEYLHCGDCIPEDHVDVMTAAILHDVVEDTAVTLDDLKTFGLSKNVIEAVDVLTKREEDDYFDYIRKVKNNKIARYVKDADLRTNMDLSRIPNPGKKDLERVEKYKKARKVLNS